MTIARKEGFDFGFDPEACKNCSGNCCRGETGNIWVTQDEIEAMCHFLQTNQIDFISIYLNRVDNRFSIKERMGERGLECVFFDSLKKCCSIYPARPRQCSTFPFWEYFKKHVDDLIKECPGIRM
jgi:Fe-S-cluster containining protein